MQVLMTQVILGDYKCLDSRSMFVVMLGHWCDFLFLLPIFLYLDQCFQALVNRSCVVEHNIS